MIKRDRKSINTFSIVGFDPVTKELGVAVASKFLSVGSVVPWAKAGVGAVATQSWANPAYGSRGLELMEQGKTAEETLKIITSEDENETVRQVGLVDAQGNSATFTGSECYSWAGGINGPNFACQGNILVDEKTVQAMANIFQKSKGDLATRLTKALLAGDAAGGDSRGKQSAALLVVKEKGGYAGFNDRYIDLRVDDHTEPVKELERILQLHQLYFKKSSPEDILKVEGQLQDEIASALIMLDYIKTNTPSEQDVIEALHSFHLIENFDERVQGTGYVDKKVVEYLELLAKR
ncbi:DUF1028 domain-containing protein [Bacillus sp. FJAT-45350]|uniref:DUF1028 domain-containing protein n=1 Tax=Bacillus sp. FJAT-45350 TaxID=2011014 RepID=UPI000BB71722|nr:DUF1028 domain-containing protein [Bacillus sp. FJAT-45350]